MGVGITKFHARKLMLLTEKQGSETRRIHHGERGQVESIAFPVYPVVRLPPMFFAVIYPITHCE
jgi:hypothetical protein